MTYDKLIEALRYCATDADDEFCVKCAYFDRDCENLKLDAADALEAADKRIDNLQQTCDKLASNLQQAQLPKDGEWIGVEYDGYADGCPVYDVWECSGCGEEHNGEEDTLPNYCPNCGARMKGEHDEQID